MDISDLKIDLIDLKWKGMIEEWGQSYRLVDKNEKMEFARAFLIDGIIAFQNDADDPCENTPGMRVPIENIRELAYDGENGVILTLQTGACFSYRGTRIDENNAYIDPRITEGYFADTSNIATITEAIKIVFPEYKDCIWYDVLNEEVVVDKRIFAGKYDGFGRDQINGVEIYGGRGSSILGQFQLVFGHWMIRGRKRGDNLGQEKGYVPDASALDRAIKMLGEGNKRNPFIDLITSRSYNPENKIAETFLEKCGCEGPPKEIDPEGKYVRAMSRAWFYAIIERLADPSSKAEELDYRLSNNRAILFLPVLIGQQGSGKSSIAEAMGLHKWKNSLDGEGWWKQVSASSSEPQKWIENSRGSVISELVESTQLERDNPADLKRMIETMDIYIRAPYAEKSRKVHLFSMMVATTNKEQILNDLTGGRRFYPLRVNNWKKSDTEMSDGLKYVINAKTHPDIILDAYAEAYHDVMVEGKRWYDIIDDPEIDRLCKFMQRQATRSIEGEDVIRDYLDYVHPEVGSIVLNGEIKALLQGRSQTYLDTLNEKIKIPTGPRSNPKVERYMADIARITHDGTVDTANFDQRTQYSASESDKIFKQFSEGSIALFGFERIGVIHFTLEEQGIVDENGKTLPKQRSEKGFIRKIEPGFFG